MSNPDDPVKKSQEFFGRCSSRPRSSPKSSSRRTSGCASRSRSLEAAAARPAATPTTRPGAQPRASASSRSAWPEVEARYRKVEEENKEFADRYIEIEEQNNNLANLYVASYQLHSTLDYKEVVRIVQEIVINLIGAEAFHLFMVSEKTGSSSWRPPRARRRRHGHRRWARASSARRPRPGENYFAEQVAHREPTPFDAADRRHPPEDQGQRDRRHLHQQAAGPEDRVHHHGLRAVHAAGRPRRHRHLLGQAVLDLRAEAHHPAGLPRHAEDAARK